MFLTCLAMTGEERVTSYEIIIPAFTRFTMTKKEKITHQAEHTTHSPLWIFFLSLGASPPLVYRRNTLVFVNTSSSPCHCEEPSFLSLRGVKRRSNLIQFYPQYFSLHMLYGIYLLCGQQNMVLPFTADAEIMNIYNHMGVMV